MSQSGPAGLSPESHAIVRTFTLAAGEQFAPHTHDQHQLTCAIAGVLTARIGEQTWILPPTRALWIPAGVPHEIAADRAAILRGAYIHTTRIELSLRRTTPLRVDALLLCLLERLENEDLPVTERRRTEAVLFDVIRPVDVLTVTASMPYDERALAVADGLLADPADPRTIEQWGRSVGATGRTLARLFSDQTGLTFGQWRTAIRISAALGQLADGASVAKTARAVGYETASAFIAAFARQLGCTPAAYFNG